MVGSISRIGGSLPRPPAHFEREIVVAAAPRSGASAERRHLKLSRPDTAAPTWAAETAFR